jgi:hypothetical protein
MESRNRANRPIEISSDFQRHVNRFCFLIVASECSDREIDIERRVQVATLFPEKMPLYDVVLREPFPSASAAVP